MIEQTIPTIEPTRFVAGDTVQWTKSLAGYSAADGWVASYVFVREGAKKVVTGTDDGSGAHLLTIAAADSANWAAGTYHWQGYVSKGDERRELGSGVTDVRANFAAVGAGGLDARSDWERILDELKTALKDYVITGGARTAFNINGRVTQFETKADLIKAIHNAELEVERERAADRTRRGLGTNRTVRVRY